MAETLIAINSDELHKLQQDIEDLKKMLSSVLNTNESTDTKLLYTNKEVQDMLGVGDKLLRQYRKDGLIGFSKVSDKFFYKKEQILQFLDKHYHKPYAYDYL